MTEERRIQLVAEVNTTQTREGFNEISQQASTMASSVSRAGQQASSAVSDIGSGADRSAKNVEVSQRNLIASIQRTTAAMEAGGKTGSQYYEVLARQRGVDVEVLRPYLAALDAITAKQKAAADAIRSSDPTMKQFGVSAAQTTAALRQMPAQLTDIFTSLSGGQNPLQVLIQQGGQIKDSFGGVSNTLSVLGGQVKSFFSSLGGASSSIGDIADLGGALADVARQQEAVSGGAEQAGDGLSTLADGANTATEAASNARTALTGVTTVSVTTVAAAVAVTAAVVAVAVAYYKGSQEADAYRKSIILTGNAAGTTVSQLNGMAASIAKQVGTQGQAAEALAMLAGTGKVGAENLRQFGATAVLAQKTIGMAVSDTVAAFSELGKSPLQASEKFTEQYHYMSLAVYSQIKALQDQGKTEEAAAVAQKAYSDAIESRGKEIEASLGVMQKGWTAVGEKAKQAWDWMLDVGREDTLDQKLEKAQAALAKAKIARFTFAGGGSDGKADLDKAQAEVEALQRQATAAKEKAAAQAESVRLEEAGIALAKEEEKYLPRKERLARDLVAARNLVTQAARPGEESVVTEQRIATLQMNIRKQYSDIFNAGIDSQIEAIKRRGAVEEEVAKRTASSLAAIQAAGAATSLAAQISYAEQVEANDQAALGREKARLQDIFRLTKGKQNSETEQASIRGAIEDVEAKQLTRKLKLKDDIYVLDIKDSRQAAANLDALAGKRDAELQSLVAQVKAQKDSNSLIGASKQQINSFNLALAEESATRLENQAAIIGNDSARQREAETMRASAAEIRALAEARAAGILKTEDFEQQKRLWDSIDQTAHDTFVSIFDSGKSAFDRLRDTLKNGLLDMLYQMTVKRWIFSIGAEVSGYSGIAQTAAGAIGGGQGGMGSMSALSSLGALSSSSSYLGQFASGYSGSAAAASQALGAPMTTSAQLGSYTGAAAPYLAGAGGGLAAYTYGEKYGAAGGLAAGAGTIAAGGAASAAIGGTSIAAGATAALAAIPVWGWAALAAMAIIGGMQDGPEEHTRMQFASNNAVGNINNNERGESWAAPYIGNGSTSALGTFGVRSTFWMDPNQDAVQSFLKTVGQTDDALASFMTATEKASVTSYLTGKTYTANTGAEGTNPNANGELDKVFADRITNILEGIEPGLSKLEIGFAGTSQELATEAAALLSFRAALKESGETVFGAKVTLQEIAALKLPTETTSAALARVTAEFNITSQVAQLLGKDVSKAFGATGLASEAARAQLIQLSGGMATFSQQAAAYAQTYLTDEERNKVLVKQVTEQMSALGLASITTKDQFKALVMGLDLSSEADAKRYAALMKVSGDFATAADATAAAIAKAQEAAKATAGLDGQIYDLTHTAAEALARQRQVELAAMTATDAELQKRIYALNDERAAAEKLVGAAGSSLTRLTDAISSEKALKAAAHQADMTAIQARIDAEAAAIGKIKGLSDLLHTSMDQVRPTGDQAAERRAAQAQIESAIAIAKAGGPLPTAESLKQALATVGKDASGLFGTQADFQRDQYRTMNALAALSTLTDKQLTGEQLTLAVLEDQKKITQDAFDAEVKRLDDILGVGKAQVDSLNGINTSVLTIPTALAALAASISAAMANPIAAAPSVVTSAYQQYLGRTPEAGAIDHWTGQAGQGVDVTAAIKGSNEARIQELYRTLLGRNGEAAGVDSWERALAAGQTMEQIRAGFLTSDEYKKLHPFAVGTNRVPKTMPALVHEDERIIPAADNRELLRRLSSPADDNSALLAEVRALRAEVAKLQAPTLATAENTKKSANALLRATQGNNYLMTKAVAA
ncbi:phage tail length tape measure family protein [Rugamonas sp. DEMB1]|uniref:phage tail length tape measure family protein n=1 Tax=Rugamonas sp. DEMB1 TaxID=3039386 RepID=UPI00244A9A84|nr:phage tail length tape measure family protein [Rugamonas sp. DEMB1]WGG51830.1 phage tail length tape measure family protein [Rugamonas sp. DEMB1]